MAALRHIDLTIGGMNCPHCPRAIEKALGHIDGVGKTHVNLANQTASVDYDPDRARVADMLKAIRTLGQNGFR